jgi:DNA end-binding protein Ku
VTESEGLLDRSDIVKGYEYSKGEYVMLEPKEPEKVRIPTKRAIEMRQFVDEHTIDFEYFDKPYFVMPDDEDQAKTFNVGREALAETKKAGLGEVAFGGREHLVALMPSPGKESKGMMAYTLKYAEELRDGGRLFSKIKASKIDPDQLQLAKDLIQRNSAKFDPKKYKDDYEAALRELIEAKMHHKPLPREVAPHRAEVINLTDALRRSLSENAATGQTSGSRGRGPAKKRVRAAEGKGPKLVASAQRHGRTA